MHWSYMVVKDNNRYYLSEVFYERKKKRKIKHNKFMYCVISEGKNREDILKKITQKGIEGDYNAQDFDCMKKDLIFFRKVLYFNS